MNVGKTNYVRWLTRVWFLCDGPLILLENNLIKYVLIHIHKHLLMYMLEFKHVLNERQLHTGFP